MVVGVARNAVIDSPSEPVRPLVYHPWAQLPVNAVTLHVRAAGADALALAAPARRALASAHPDLAALDPGTLADHMQAATFVQSVGASAFTTFGAIALAIAVVGLFGVVAQYVAEHRREIAIAVALGAPPRRIAATVAGPAARLTALGLAVGAALSAAAAVLLRNQLDGSFSGPMPIVVSLIVLIAVAVVSCAWPTWQAMRTDPISAVRSE